jgi:hypothetical protein
MPACWNKCDETRNDHCTTLQPSAKDPTAPPAAKVEKLRKCKLKLHNSTRPRNPAKLEGSVTFPPLMMYSNWKPWRIKITQFGMNVLLKRFTSNASKAANAANTGNNVKIINSHQTVQSAEVATQLNSLRTQQIYAYQRKSAQKRREHANFAQTFPTREQRESETKGIAASLRQTAWDKYIEGVKRSLNPPVKELQAAGKIPSPDPERRAEKVQKGRLNLLQALKQQTLMRRKYINFLSTETIPSLVTPENLDAKIQSALDSPSSYNLSAHDVINNGETILKRKLREIRVPMDDYQQTDKNDHLKDQQASMSN